MRGPLKFFRDFFAGVAGLFARGRGQDPVWQQRWTMPYPIAGLALTADEILSLATVWACIDAISSSLAASPWNVYQVRKSGTHDLIDDDPLAYLLNLRPNPDMPALNFRQAQLMCTVPFGNGYAEIVRDGGGRVAQLWPMPNDRVTPRRDRKTWELVYEYRQPDGTIEILSQRDVLHFRGPGLHGLMGDNVVARAAKSMAVAAAQERHAASYFGQGANPGGVLKAPGEVDEKKHKRLVEDWAEKKKGPENAHKPLILEAGWDWVPADTDAQKSQLVESRQYSVEEIARWFRVPLHKVGHLLRATFSNIEQQNIEFVNDCLWPWCVAQQQETDYKLIRQDRGPRKVTLIDTSRLLMGDFKSRTEAYASARQNGWLNGNEIRHREGMNPMGPDGDVYLVNGTLKPIEQAIEPPPPPAPKQLPPGAPGEKEPQEDGAGDDQAEVDSADAVAREAFVVLTAGALERFVRRLANGRAALKGRTTEDLEVQLERVREQQLDRLMTEVQAAAPFARRVLGRAVSAAELKRAVALLDIGETPLAAAEKLLRVPSA